MSLEIGKAVPDFSLVADNGKPYKLSSKIKKNILLVFYPGDGTPVCTSQFIDYSENVDKFKNLDVEIVGISSNDSKSHTKFKKDNNLPFTLLSDSDAQVAKDFGCFDWFGNKRALFLIDNKLVLKYKHIEPVSIFKRTAEELLESIKKKSQ